MSQHDFTIANDTRTAVRGDIQSAIQALASSSIGSSRPSTTYDGQIWIDNNTPTSAVQAVYFVVDPADSAKDILIGYRDTTNTRWIAADDVRNTDIASAGTTDIGAARGRFVKVTGTTTITALGTAPDGAWRLVQFTGALTLTYDATALELPGAASITTVAGDSALFVSKGSGNWKCHWYQRAAAPPGGAGQFLYTQSSTYLSCPTPTPNDDSKPQITEGTQVLSRAIVPRSTSSVLEIEVELVCSSGTASSTLVAALFQDAGTDALAAAAVLPPNADTMTTLRLRWLMTAGTTSSTTFTVRLGDGAGTAHFNGAAGARLYGGVAASSISVREIAA